MADDEWSIQQIAKIAGTTSRTLRHYGEIGLLPPSSVGHNGYRHYDRNALVRLQRILLLRELGLGLPQIGEVLARESIAGRRPDRPPRVAAPGTGPAGTADRVGPAHHRGTERR